MDNDDGCIDGDPHLQQYEDSLFKFKGLSKGICYCFGIRHIIVYI